MCSVSRVIETMPMPRSRDDSVLSKEERQKKKRERMEAEKALLEELSGGLGAHVIAVESTKGKEKPWEVAVVPTHAICLGHDNKVIIFDPSGSIRETDWAELTKSGRGNQVVAADSRKDSLPQDSSLQISPELCVARAQQVLLRHDAVQAYDAPATEYPRLCEWCSSGRFFSRVLDMLRSLFSPNQRNPDVATESTSAKAPVSPTPALRENREQVLLSAGEAEVRRLLSEEHQYPKEVIEWLLYTETLAFLLLEEGYESPMASAQPPGPEGDWIDMGLTRALLDNTFFPGKGRSLQYMLDAKGYPKSTTAESYTQENLIHFGGAACQVLTLDRRRLEAFWAPPRDSCVDTTVKEAVIIFHPNFAVALDMARHGTWYRRHGFGVLLLTMGGYASSEGDTTELTTYLDAHAAVQHVHVQKGVPLERILCHGISIGGALATAAAYMHPGVHCTVDQTFTNTRDVAESLLGSQEGSWIQSTPLWLIGGFVSTVFPQGASDERLPGIVTDGYNNEAKAGKLEGGFFVIWAERDQMMPPEFATRLLEAYMEARKLDDDIARIACIEGGGHGAWFFENQKVLVAYTRYLRHLGFAATAARDRP